MQPGPLPAELIAAAPEISGRLGRILMALAALVAHAFLRDPRHVGLINPLWRYITRTARRFDSIITRRVAGKQRSHAPRPGRVPQSTPRKPRVRLPTHRAWLVTSLGHFAAGYANQLNHLLSEPEAAALIAASPQAARLLRPLCHLLGISPAALQPPPKQPRKVGCPPAPHRSVTQAEPGGIPTHPPSPLLAGTGKPAAAAPPPRSLYPPPPCEHITWWPWFPPRSERERLA
jgi:hypothetical protein